MPAVEEAGGGSEEQPPVRAEAEARGHHPVAADDAQARRHAGRRGDAPFAALPDHQVGVERIDRGPQRAIGRGAEELPHEGTGLRVPDADPPRLPVLLRRPELALSVNRQRADLEQTFRLPGADETPPRPDADGARRLAVAAQHLHVVAVAADAAVDVAVPVNRDRRHPVLAFEGNRADLAHRAGVRVHGEDLLRLGHGVERAVGAQLKVARLRHSKQAEPVAGLGVENRHHAAAATADKDLAVARGQAVGPVGNVGLAREHLAHREVGAVVARPHRVGAGPGVDPVQAARRILPMLVPDKDRLSVRRHQAGGGDAAADLLPQDLPVGRTGQQGLRPLAAAPADVDALAVGRHRTRIAMVGAPDVAPRGLGGAPGPAAQDQAHPRMPEAAPRVVPRLQRLSGHADGHRAQAVPTHLVRALRVEGAGEQLAGHGAVGPENVQRDVAVLLDGEPDGLEAFRLTALHQPGPVNGRQSVVEAHRELAPVAQPHRSRGEPAAVGEGREPPAVRALEGEHPVYADLRAEDILDRQAAAGAGQEVGFDGQCDLGPGRRPPAVAREQRPRNGQLLRVAAPVVPDRKGLPAPLLRGIGRTLVELLPPVDFQHGDPVAVAPRRDVAGAGAGMIRAGILLRAAAGGGRRQLVGRGGEHTHLQAVAGETVVALDAAGVVQRRQIHPAGQQVKVLRVPHGMEPDGVLVALVLDVAAGEDAGRQIPVADLAVNGHRPRPRHDLKVKVLGLGCAAQASQQNGRRRNPPPRHRPIGSRHASTLSCQLPQNDPGLAVPHSCGVAMISPGMSATSPVAWLAQ
ncbi:MAG: hypothetical protein BWZ02_03149 [Lentisphaerae bacterium ADurb.BinA184]|nr:MAG: hypothetical protein BWZ02_03149 [Lentisphaerae bacterium ADurb.BinA184]